MAEKEWRARVIIIKYISLASSSSTMQEIQAATAPYLLNTAIPFSSECFRSLAAPKCATSAELGDATQPPAGAGMYSSSDTSSELDMDFAASYGAYTRNNSYSSLTNVSSSARELHALFTQQKGRLTLHIPTDCVCVVIRESVVMRET